MLIKNTFLQFYPVFSRDFIGWPCKRKKNLIIGTNGSIGLFVFVSRIFGFDSFTPKFLTPERVRQGHLGPYLDPYLGPLHPPLDKIQKLKY